jgi:hypothetical protein
MIIDKLITDFEKMAEEAMTTGKEQDIEAIMT